MIATIGMCLLCTLLEEHGIIILQHEVEPFEEFLWALFQFTFID